MNKRPRIISGMCIILLLFLLSGCAERPFLTKGGIYSIISISSEGKVEREPIKLTWNANLAVMQQLLLEASFVLGDLRSLSELIPSEVVSITNHDLSQNDLIQTTQHPPEENPLLRTTNLDSMAEPDHPPTETILLEATFPEAKPFELLIDDELTILEISSIQIEVIGNYPGRVILNQDIILQGIPNPNLESSFNEFLKMLQKTEQVPVRYGGNLA